MPARILKDIDDASGRLPDAIVTAVAPLCVTSTNGAPEITRLVIVLVDHIVPVEPVITILPVPKSIVRALLLLEETVAQVKTYVLRVKVPVVSVNAPAKVQDPDRLKLMSDLLTVQEAHVAVAATVTNAAVPLFASNMAASALVGADAPAAPPDVADQLAVEVSSHVPVPPTQNLLAMIYNLRLNLASTGTAGTNKLHCLSRSKRKVCSSR